MDILLTNGTPVQLTVFLRKIFHQYQKFLRKKKKKRFLEFKENFPLRYS